MRRRIAPGLASGLAVAALTAGGLGLAAVASAAPNPTVSNTSTHAASIATDGSYRLDLDQTVELAIDSSVGIGGDIPDGFRLPDENGPIPPYLRPEYGDANAMIDGTADRVAPQRVYHWIDYMRVVDGSEGVHRGQLSVEVRGSALPAATAIPTADDSVSGAAVFIRPLRRGDLRITSAKGITGVDCITVPPLAVPCGHADGDAWVVTADEFGPAGAVRVRTALDPKGLAPATIDRG